MMMHPDRLSLILMLALFGCAAPGPELRVRPQAAAAPADQDALVHAASLYARGEYALAIEAYRKVIRFEPRSAAAHAGLAVSYDRIGRFDLADRYFQLAMAIEPRNSGLASTYAQALDRHGYPEQAGDVLRLIAAEAPDRAAGTPEVAYEPSVIARGSSVTITLDPAPTTPPDRPKSTHMRLERVSLAEVALVARPAPVAAPLARGSRVRIALDDPVDLSKAPMRGIRILNGVGRRGQAARMRAHLQHAGWRDITIGDATQRPWQSQLYAPAQSLGRAQAFADRLPFRVTVARSAAHPAMVLVLGANSVTFDDRLKAGRN